jgi:hypothetical protein
MYIWTPRRWQIEKQIANYRVLDLVKLYNFDIKSIFIRFHLKKVMTLFS